MEHSSFMGQDEGVMNTNDDASECKKSAVFRGYYRDEYISYFVKNPDRKAPEINRGYYARVKGVEMCIERFLKVGSGLAFHISFIWGDNKTINTCHLDPCVLHMLSWV